MSETAMAANGKSHRGRPRKGQEPGERAPLGLRVTPPLKERLVRAAEESGRSLSQEVELMLEKAFLIEDLLRARLISARVPAVSEEKE
jgi:predicted HicB family RNase H-like nuclease